MGTRPSVGRMLWRGLRRRCPNCGARRLFSRWFTLCERCPGCGLALERGEGFMLGTLALNIVATSAAFAVYLVVGFVATAPDPPIGALTAGALALCLVAPVVLYPFAKMVWAAVDLAMRPPDVVECAEAATYLAARAADARGTTAD